VYHVLEEAEYHRRKQEHDERVWYGGKADQADTMFFAAPDHDIPEISLQPIL
jgi:hypothetical protein